MLDTFGYVWIRLDIFCFFPARGELVGSLADYIAAAAVGQSSALPRGSPGEMDTLGYVACSRASIFFSEKIVHLI